MSHDKIKLSPPQNGTYWEENFAEKLLSSEYMELNPAWFPHHIHPQAEHNAGIPSGRHCEVNSSVSTLATSKTTWYLITECFIQLLHAFLSLFFFFLLAAVVQCLHFKNVVGQADSCAFIAPWLDNPLLDCYNSCFLCPQQNAKGMQKPGLLSFLTAGYGINATGQREDLWMRVATWVTGHFSN